MKEKGITMHSIFGMCHQLAECPEDVLFFVEVHKKDCSDLGHALAVAHLRVVHGVGGQDVEQSSLATVVTFSEHDVISICSIHVLKNKKRRITQNFILNFVFSLRVSKKLFV